VDRKNSPYTYIKGPNITDTNELKSIIYFCRGAYRSKWTPLIAALRHSDTLRCRSEALHRTARCRADDINCCIERWCRLLCSRVPRFENYLCYCVASIWRVLSLKQLYLPKSWQCYSPQITWALLHLRNLVVTLLHTRSMITYPQLRRKTELGSAVSSTPDVAIL
jgi:hypothetical protein